jgi:signal transduction histidine kinase
VIGLIAWWQLAGWQWQHDRPWFWSDVAAGIVGLVAMQYRRRWPMSVVCLTIALGFVSASVGGASTIVLASVATRRRWREIIAIAIASVVQAMVFESLNPADTSTWPVSITAAVAITGVTIATGMYIGSRRELLYSFRQRAETAEKEQAARVAQARTAERATIAREMHDVLAHRISLVAMHAGALAYRTDLTPDEVRAASAIIQDNAHQALSELRDVLGILRDDRTGDAPNRPQPDWSDLPDLVAEARRAGMNVTYTNNVTDPDLPERTGRTVYRIVQETLTNARKHAPDTEVQVLVGGSASEGLCVTVRNPLRVGSRRLGSPPSGLGLVGLKERAALSGGSLHHEVNDAGEFLVEAQLPWAG